MSIQIYSLLMKSKNKNSVMVTAIIAQAWKKENLAHKMTKISVKNLMKWKRYWMSWKESNKWRIQTHIIISKSKNRRFMKENII